MNTTQYQTRGVLAGAYKGRREIDDRALLTHLVRVENDRAVCNSRLNVCDEYAHTAEELAARPTCPKCAARWDREHAG
jgi:hypothetical protein